MNIYYQNPATVHMQVWYIQRFSDRLTSIWLEQMKRNGWLKTQHLRTTSSMQSSRFQGQISTSICLKVTRISSHLEPQTSFKSFNISLKSHTEFHYVHFQKNCERQFSHDDIAFPNTNKQRRHLMIFYTKQHLQMTCNFSQKNNSN